tara:strand:- start:4 stop:369 length:366 start_codon:yes stop_codon:yes gene_type:complete
MSKSYVSYSTYQAVNGKPQVEEYYTEFHDGKKGQLQYDISLPNSKNSLSAHSPAKTNKWYIGRNLFTSKQVGDKINNLKNMKSPKTLKKSSTSTRKKSSLKKLKSKSKSKSRKTLKNSRKK